MAAKTVSENSMFDEKKDTNSLKTYSEKCHNIYGVSYCISLFLLHDFLTVVQHLSRHICKYTRNNTTPISNKMLRLLDSNTGQIRYWTALRGENFSIDPSVINQYSQMIELSINHYFR
jgi:hypothetical protein